MGPLQDNGRAPHPYLDMILQSRVQGFGFWGCGLGFRSGWCEGSGVFLTESGPLMAVHLSRYGLGEGSCCPLTNDHYFYGRSHGLDTPASLTLKGPALLHAPKPKRILINSSNYSNYFNYLIRL